MNNPYAVTVSRESVSERSGVTSVMVVAGMLILLSALTILLESWLIVFPTTCFLVTTILDTPNFTLWMINGWGYMAIGAFVFAAHWMVLFGSICMWRKSSHRFAVLAMVLSVFPVLSPLYGLGMPFGIWGLVALPRSRIR